MEELDSAMNRAKEFEDLNQSHTDGYGSADDIRVLYKEILRLRKELVSSPNGVANNEFDLTQ